MCELVHLATMKHYYLRFINLMTTRLEAETGLRNPTILESQSADKTLMTSACDLVMEKQWSFDDAIHEITFIRAEINTLLQARPKLPAQTYQRLNPLPLRGRGNHSEQLNPFWTLSQRCGSKNTNQSKTNKQDKQDGLNHVAVLDYFFAVSLALSQNQPDS